MILEPRSSHASDKLHVTQDPPLYTTSEIQQNWSSSPFLCILTKEGHSKHVSANVLFRVVRILGHILLRIYKYLSTIVTPK